MDWLLYNRDLRHERVNISIIMRNFHGFVLGTLREKKKYEVSHAFEKTKYKLFINLQNGVPVK